MSRRYPPDEKAAILERLRENRGDILLTHVQTGVPERTLRAWHREIQIRQLPPPLPPTPLRRQQTESPSPQTEEQVTDPAAAPPTFKNDLDAVLFLRSQIMKELLNLSTSLDSGLYVTTPYQRALVLTQLLDRLMKLDEHLRPYASFDYGDDDVKIAYHQPTFEQDDDDDLQPDPFSYPSAEPPEDVEEP